MPLEVKRKDKETAQSLLHRFTRNVQQSGILFRARKRRFKERKKSPETKKRAALRREELKKEYEKSKKLGKLQNKRWS
jgi:ribosomal protein S21